MYQNIMLGVVLVLLLILLRSVSSGSGRTIPKKAAAKRKARAKKSAAAIQQQSAYHSIGCVGDCRWLEPYKGKRYLPDEAPPLPVPECTSSNCKCRYVHYDDRREDDADRRGIVGLRNELYSHSGESDRRTRSRGRRDSDYT
jgi:hypothetical protein